MNPEASPPPAQHTVMVTGATGLLGRSLMGAFGANGGFVAIGAGFRRSGPRIVCLDLRKREDVFAAVARHRPTIIVHAAAQRRPDEAEKHPEEAFALNAGGTKHMVEAAAAHGAWLLYISTDYVFDGSSPPYSTGAIPNPVNVYGRTKLAGEKLALASNFAVLRVPMLYGPVAGWGESPVTEMVPALLANIGKPVWFDNWAVRYPTHVDDVASACLRLAAECLEGRRPSGIHHASAHEAFTRMEMATIMAQKLGVFDIEILSSARIANPNRPRDCRLDTSASRRFSLPAPKRFVEGISEVLAGGAIK